LALIFFISSFLTFFLNIAYSANEEEPYFLLPPEIYESYLPSGKSYLIPEDEKTASLLKRARIFEEKHNYRQASKYYLLASRKTKNRAAIPFLLFKYCTLQDDIDASIECLESIVNDYSDFPLIQGVWFEIALRQFGSRRWEAALKSLEEIEKFEGEKNRVFTPYVYTFMGIIKSIKGEYNEALNSYVNSLLLLSSMHDERRVGSIMRNYIEIARCLIELGRYGDAKALLVRIYGTSSLPVLQAETLLLLGEVCEREGEIIPASAAYSRVIEDYPDTLQSLKASGSLGRLGKSKTEYAGYPISGLYDSRLLLGVYGTGVSGTDIVDSKFGYTIQVGSFSLEQNALKLVEELKKRGFPAYSTKANIGGRDVFRVRVGSYRNMREAEPLKKELENLGYKALVLKEE
jgi:tetratricopeptide (TPR) repeat protein